MLGADPVEIGAGLAFQDEVLRFLNYGSFVTGEFSWMETRRLILSSSGRSESTLSGYELSELNLEESIRGDLTDVINDVAMECQTAVSGLDASWEHSKRVRCQASWQCFGFRSGIRLVVRTGSIRHHLDFWRCEPQESRRCGGGPYYSLSEHFLRGIGAVDLHAWKWWYVDRLTDGKREECR